MRFFLLLSLFASLFTTCGDDSDACLNDPDCEYFRCKVNGEDWSTNCERDPLFACSAIDVQYYKNSDTVEFAVSNGEEKESIILNSRKIKLGSNKLFINNSIQTKFSDAKKNTNCIKFYLDTLKNNELYFSIIDTINYKLEGAFSLECKNECNEVVKITDGNFRVKYRF